MSGRLAGLADLLVPDETGRRALEETLADWREERAAASTRLGRMRQDTRGLLAVATVLTAATRLEILSGRALTVVSSSLGLSALLGFGTMYLGIAFGGSSWYLLSNRDWLVLTMWLLPGAAVLWLPVIAAAGPGKRRAEAFPVLGASLMTAAALVVIVGWIVPLTNQRYREHMWSVTREAGSAPTISRGPGELSLPELVRTSRDAGPAGSAAAAVLSRRGLLVFMVPLFVVLGCAVRSRLASPASLRARWLAGLTALGVLWLLDLVGLNASLIGAPLLVVAAILLTAQPKARNVGTRNPTREP